MQFALLIFGVAFAALCVWLTVRIVNRRERWAKWTLAGLMLAFFVGYPLSIGPAIWASDDQRTVGATADYRPSGLMRTYWPVGWAATKLPCGKVLVWYARRWAPHNRLISIPISSDGSDFLFFGA